MWLPSSYVLQLYLSALSASESFVESRKPEMTHSLDVAIMKLNEQLVTTATNVNEGIFLDPFADPHAVLEQVGARELHNN